MFANRSSFGSHLPIRLVWGVLLMSGCITSVHAARFGVHVVAPDGMPLSGVAVCVGMPGNHKQFGAAFTDTNGNAMMDVPNVPLVVTVSKNRFTSTRVSQPARNFDLIREVTLVDGVPGPRCRAESSLVNAPSVPDLHIAEIDVRDEAGSVVLRPQVGGDPSHYRVGTSPEFFGASWERFDNQITLNAALSAESRLFVQLRRYQGNDDLWIESLSSVVTLVLKTGIEG